MADQVGRVSGNQVGWRYLTLPVWMAVVIVAIAILITWKQTSAYFDRAFGYWSSEPSARSCFCRSATGPTVSRVILKNGSFAMPWRTSAEDFSLMSAQTITAMKVTPIT